MIFPRYRGFTQLRGSTRLGTIISSQPHDYTATELQLQSTIDIYWSRRRSNELQKGGDSVRPVKPYRQVKSPQGGSLLRQAPRVYWEVDQQVYQVDQGSTEAAYREGTYQVDRMFTEPDSERRLPCQAASTSQCRVPMTTGCKIYYIELAEALHRAQMALARLNLLSITISEKLTCWISTDITRLTRTIDGYDRCGSGSSPQCRVMSGSSTTLMIPTMMIATMTYDEIYELREWMVWGVWVQFGSGAMEVGITFGCFLVSLFSSSLVLISARYKWHRHGFSPPLESIKWRWIFPVRRIRRKVAIELYRLVVGLMSSYDCVHRMIVSFLFLYPYFLLYWLWQPRRSAPKERDNVTAWSHMTCPGPGNLHSM